MDGYTAKSSPLYQQNPTERFSNRAQDYAQHRPSYPATAIAHILADLGDPSSLTAADIGAGTGISARLLAEQGVTVWAIEPNAAMRQAAEPHPHITWQDGQAETTGLPDAAVDLVTCCQAFHWFRPEPSLQEFHRILRPSGRLALMWNDRDESDEFVGQYTQLLRDAAGNRYLNHADHRELEVVQHSPLFKDYQALTFPYHQFLTLEGLIGRAMSSSYVPQSGAAAEQLVTNLTQLHQRFSDADGRVRFAYVTRLYLVTYRETVNHA
ncbi:MAG: class I SAM-dependent methyltransferase [Thainema sp.]